MDRNFLHLYNIELQHIRSMAGEFAREYPKIAGRLALDRDGKEVCPDPFVERLIEAFAFLAARVQVKFDAEFPRFTQALLENIFPHYLSPIPSMAVVGFQPNLGDKALAEGFTIPRGTPLNTTLSKEGNAICSYRTAHSIKLWPIVLQEVEYMDRNTHSLELPPGAARESAIRFRFGATADLRFHEIGLDKLDLFLRGPDELPARLMEHLLAMGTGVWLRGVGPATPWRELPQNSLTSRGLGAEDSLLPTHANIFEGYRLLIEYFAFPARFRFLVLNYLNKIPLPETSAIEVVIPLQNADPHIRPFVNPEVFALYATPAVNLFEKRMDRIALDRPTSEHHVVPDRTRPLDFEVHSISSVTGYGKKAGEEQPFMPFYLARDEGASIEAYFTVHRRLRTPTQKERQFGRLTSYKGSEVFLSIVDASAAPHRPDLAQLGVTALCTNRHLPILLSQGDREAAFQCDITGPVARVRCLSGPTPPRPSLAVGETAWRLISHLSLNHHSLTDTSFQDGAVALREMLLLYVDPHDKAFQKQIDGLLSVQTTPILRRMPSPGMITFARGLEVRLTFDEEQFTGTGIFLLGMVLNQFLSRYVTINSFTETVICSKQRGDVIRWPFHPGSKGSDPEISRHPAQSPART